MLRNRAEPSKWSVSYEAIERSDAVLIATPEYNHGSSGLIKTPQSGCQDQKGIVHFQKKTVAVMGASPSQAGTSRAQDQLRFYLNAMNAYVLNGAEVRMFRANEKSVTVN